jgi:hypothetical protein
MSEKEMIESLNKQISSESSQDGGIRSQEEIADSILYSGTVAMFEQELEEALSTRDEGKFAKLASDVDMFMLVFQKHMKDGKFYHNRVYYSQFLWLAARYYSEVAVDKEKLKFCLDEGARVSGSLTNDSIIKHRFRRLARENSK